MGGRCHPHSDAGNAELNCPNSGRKIKDEAAAMTILLPSFPPSAFLGSKNKAVPFYAASGGAYALQGVKRRVCH